MSVISVNNLTFAYDGSYSNIFENVSFQLDTDWKLGFVGRNGRGKTTFLNLLLDKYEYKGSISKSVVFDYFPFTVEDKSVDTITIVDMVCHDYEPWQLSRELSMLRVDEDVLYRAFSTLSGGEQAKVLLAALFLCQNHFLLLDEPTNHLDSEARDIIAQYLKTKKGFILVSHDRMFLDECTDHVLSINKTNIEIQKGNFSSWWENKKLQDEFEASQNQKLKKDIKRLAESSKRTANWSDSVEKTKYASGNSGIKQSDTGYVGHKAAKMMKTSKRLENRRQNAIDKKSALLKNVESIDELKLHPLKYHSNRLISLKDVSINYDSNTVCENISIAVEVGDRISVLGRNGSGKTSVLKLILGSDTDVQYSGDISTASGLKISYVPQDTSFLKGSLNDFVTKSQIDETLFKTILRKLDFEREQFGQSLEDYSEGQKKKVLIAKSLSEQAHVYVWDEPLNFIDIFSRIQIEKLILKYEPTLIFVEHDRIFSKLIATKTLEL